MISVITNENVVSNPYPGMSLAEACGQLMLETEQMVNELNMNILLTEHAYLYENGVEIEYVDEAGVENSKAAELKQKVVDFIHKIGQKISELWDKLIEWVTQRIDEVATAFKRMSITKDKFNKAKEALNKIQGVYLKDVVKYDVNYDKFLGEYEGLFNMGTGFEAGREGADKEGNMLNVYERYVKPVYTGHGSDIAIDVAAFEAAGEVVFSKDKILKDIKDCKKKANAEIEKLKKQARAAKAEDMSEELNKLTFAAKNNSKIAKDCSRVYHAYLSNQIAIIRGVFANDKIKEAIGEIKEAKKEADKAAKEADAKAKAEEKEAYKKLTPEEKKEYDAKQKELAAGKRAVAVAKTKQNAKNLFNGKYFKTGKDNK